MSTIRQDAWNSDEDLILAEVVLRHIREGSTQLAAFEEVGERLQRTSAACGFRWNSTIRKKYEAAIALAKKQRKKGHPVNMDEKEEPVSTNHVELAVENDLQDILPVSNNRVNMDSEEKSNLTLEDVISFLQQFESNVGNDLNVIHDNERLSQENDELRAQNKKLEKSIQQLKKEKDIIQEDYRLLINIMERARKMAVISEEDSVKN